MRGDKIDWDGIVGGGDDAPWQEDRLRKFARIKIEASDLLAKADALAELGALHFASPEVLRKIPGAADWYACLACFAQKTLNNLGQRAKDHGLSVSPSTFLRNMRANPGRVPTTDLASFSDWVNAEIGDILPGGLPDHRLYALHVAMVVGGRVIGQGQNEGGELAVGILKQSMLVAGGSAANWEYLDDDHWQSLAKNREAGLSVPLWRHVQTGAEVDFRAGGNRPDIRINIDGRATLVGEIKGRKDLSNTWESWMPQLADHLHTWAAEFPNAQRGVFMTVITKEMVSGVSSAGTRRTGLRQLQEQEHLDFVVNLTKLSAAPNPSVTLRFLVEALGLV